MSVVSSSVWPSAGALATIRDAMTELPPGRFSTSTGLPSDAVSCSAIARAARSVPPPGPKGTTMRTGWVGKSAAWASAGSHAASTRRIDESKEFITGLLLGGWSGPAGWGARAPRSAGPREVGAAPLVKGGDAFAGRGGAGARAERAVARFERGRERRRGRRLAHRVLD